MEILIRIGQLLLSLTLLVLLHEMGHFLTAKFFKTRVDKFYLFFNPWFSLFKIKKGETEYGIGWLPLGGYVKIAGMIDESMDKEQMKKPPQADEFRSKPAWQRLIIILAGVLVNFILAYFIYVGISYKWGETYLPNESLKYGVVVDSTTYNIGLRNGDKILAIDGKQPEQFHAILPNMIMNKTRSLSILRGTDTLVLNLPEDFQKELLELSSKSFSMPSLIQPRILFAPFYIAKVKKQSPAELAGLQKGDELLSVDGIRFEFYDEFQRYLKEHCNKQIRLQLNSNNQEKEVLLNLGEKPVLGVYVDSEKREGLQLKQHTYNFKQALVAGWQQLENVLALQVNSLKLIFTKEGANSVGGLGSMSQIFPTYWSWQSFWKITAMLSIMFAFLNVLPIPGLDGGHAVFILYEMITGRKPNQRFMEIVQTIGVLFLITLIIFVNVNDVFKFLR